MLLKWQKKIPKNAYWHKQKFGIEDEKKEPWPIKCEITIVWATVGKIETPAHLTLW